MLFNIHRHQESNVHIGSGKFKDEHILYIVCRVVYSPWTFDNNVIVRLINLFLYFTYIMCIKHWTVFFAYDKEW